jgi:hypothetical protein
VRDGVEWRECLSTRWSFLFCAVEMAMWKSAYACFVFCILSFTIQSLDALAMDVYGVRLCKRGKHSSCRSRCIFWQTCAL